MSDPDVSPIGSLASDKAEIRRLREALGMLAFEAREFLRKADYVVERAQEEDLLSVLHDAELIVDG